GLGFQCLFDFVIRSLFQCCIAVLDLEFGSVCAAVDLWTGDASVFLIGLRFDGERNRLADGFVVVFRSVRDSCQVPSACGGRNGCGIGAVLFAAVYEIWCAESCLCGRCICLAAVGPAFYGRFFCPLVVCFLYRYGKLQTGQGFIICSVFWCVGCSEAAGSDSADRK